MRAVLCVCLVFAAMGLSACDGGSDTGAGGGDTGGSGGAGGGATGGSGGDAGAGGTVVNDCPEGEWKLAAELAIEGSAIGSMDPALDSLIGHTFTASACILPWKDTSNDPLVYQGVSSGGSVTFGGPDAGLLPPEMVNALAAADTSTMDIYAYEPGFVGMRLKLRTTGGGVALWVLDFDCIAQEEEPFNASDYAPVAMTCDEDSQKRKGNILKDGGVAGVSGPTVFTLLP